MLSSDQILEDLVRDGSIDIDEWPRVLEIMLQKLHDIVHNAFPVPALPILPPEADPEVIAPAPLPAHERDEEHGSRIIPSDEDMHEVDAENQPPPSSQSSTKENEAPTSNTLSPRTPTRPPVPNFNDPQHQSVRLSSTSIQAEPVTLPPDLLSSYQATTHVLERDFAHSPPYTIQRLAEMVLYPRNHYRFLPAYLNALDRIVSVSSPITDFPLPTLNASMNGSGFLTNGDSSQVNGTSEREGLGSDESLGGALLTPIPWLRNNGGTFTGTGGPGSQHEGELHSESTETIEGPHGAGSIETVTVTVNGVPSVISAAHTPPNSTPASPTLSEQSDASTASSTDFTDAQLRQQGGVTQGELLRQEQEAGVVPATQPMHRRALATHGAAAVGRDSNAMPSSTLGSETEDDHPHARGPEEVGMEDTGPQPRSHGELSMEAAVGRAKSPPAQPVVLPRDVLDTHDDDDAGAPGQDPKDVEMEVDRLRTARDARQRQEARDADGDVIVADASGAPVHPAD